MAAIDPTNSSNPYVQPPSTAKPRSELNMETFMRLLTVQMSNQNPLEPMSDRDFFAQIAQLGQVQGLDQVKKSLEVSQAAALIGKKVTAVRPMTEGMSSSNELVTGTAKSLIVKNGEYYLGLQQDNGGIVEVKMENIQSVSG